MEQRDLIVLCAAAMLAPEVSRNGYKLAESRIPSALALAKRIWDEALNDKELN